MFTEDMEPLLVVPERLVPVLEALRRLEPLFHAANEEATHRRFTNIWRREAGAWRSIARHAHVVSSGLPASDA